MILFMATSDQDIAIDLCIVKQSAMVGIDR